MSAIKQASATPVPGLLQRMSLVGLALLLMHYACLLLGLNYTNLIDVSLVVPVLLSWGALLLSQYHELRGIELHLRRKPARVSLSASRQALRDSWRHVWQFGLLLVSINGISSLRYLQDINRSGHFLGSLLVGLVYLIVLKGLVFMPLEIALARRAEELA